MLNYIIENQIRRLLREADSRITWFKKFLRNQFEFDLDETVPSSRYYVNDNPNTKWIDYYLYDFRHTFEIMSNGDVNLIRDFAPIIYNDLGFEHGHSHVEELENVKSVIRYCKNNPDFYLNAIKGRNLSYSQLMDIMEPVLSEVENEEMSKIDNQNYEGISSNYDIFEVKDFETAKHYGDLSGDLQNKRSRLCYTQYEETWENYTKNGAAKAYICLSKDWESVSPIKGENYPYDRYGLSMIFVFVTRSEKRTVISNSNVRWNHGDNSYSNVDNMFTPSQISKLIGVRYDKVFKPYSRKELIERGKIMDNDIFIEKVRQGMTPEDIFGANNVHSISIPGINSVLFQGNYNLTDGKRLLSNEWFRYINPSFNQYKQTVVYSEVEDAWNVFSLVKGKVISDRWFTRIGDLNFKHYEVMLEGKLNLMTHEGKIVSRKWFRTIRHMPVADSYGKYFIVSVSDENDSFTSKYNILDTDTHKLVSKRYFNSVSNFHESCAIVKFIGSNNAGVLRSDGAIFGEEYDLKHAYSYQDGYSVVIGKDNKANYMDTEGNLLLDDWSDYALDFEEGYGRIGKKFNGNDLLYNYVDKEGNIILDKWYNRVTYPDSNTIITVYDEYGQHHNICLKDKSDTHRRRRRELKFRYRDGKFTV